MNISLSPCVPENLVSRDGFSRPVPRQPAHHLHTQAESGAYLRDPSRIPRRRPIMKLPYAIGSVPSLSGHHAIAYRWRSLPRVRRHRASKPQGSSERVLPWHTVYCLYSFATSWQQYYIIKIIVVYLYQLLSHNMLQQYFKEKSTSIIVFRWYSFREAKLDTHHQYQNKLLVQYTPPRGERVW